MEKTKRRSPKRDAILECLRATHDHPAAEWVYAQLKPVIPDLSLATVYRNLAQFRQDGSVRVVANVEGHERYDADTSPHSHFVCRCCGAVADLPESPVPVPVEPAVGKIESCSVTFYGRCTQCL